MGQPMLKNPRFLLSTFDDFPRLKDPRGNFLPEIAFVGRSNVGKSSLINHLLNQKKLAKTSSTPGKTQLLNFFSIDEKMILVDLPGYGYAKAPNASIQKWSKAIDDYLNAAPSLRLILLLLDSRRDITDDDRTLIEWASFKKIPLLTVLTKTDKLTPSQLEEKMKSHPDSIPYSVHNNHSRALLTRNIEKILWD
jgi:GTP-binding protein